MKTLIACWLWLVLSFHLVLAALGTLRWAETGYPQYLPWVPLALAHELGPTTSAKVRRLQENLDSCMAVLNEAQLRVTPLALRTEPQCTIPDAVSLQRFHYEYVPSYVPMSCPLAVSLGLWERHIVQNAAAQYLQTNVTRIHHYGTYNCRPIRGGRSSALSTHATATSIDIAAFDLADGRRISVTRDYGKEGPEGEFLRAVKRGGCQVFGTVLSPNYNAAHADHFHMQQRGGLCR